MSTPNSISDIVAVLRRETAFLVVSHASPDGDAVGAMAAMGFLLRRLGKVYRLYNASGMPEDFDFLSMPGPVTTEVPLDEDLSRAWVISLDCGDLHRVGPALAAKVDRSRLINIDHHLGNPGFGAVNWVDPTKCSTGEMIAALAAAFGMAPEGEFGAAVYLSLVTDTGNFSYDNTTPECMSLAAQIIRLGLRPGIFNALVQNSLTERRLRLMGRVLNGLKLADHGHIGLIRISQEDFAATGTNSLDADGLINTVRRLRGVLVAASLRQDGPAEVKFSLRSSGEVNVQQVAASFGGGGHKNAAGGTILASLDEAEAKLMAALEPLVEAHGPQA